MPAFKDLTGQTFGRLHVKQLFCRDAKNNKKRVFYKCVCSCGNLVLKKADLLRQGRSKSCGCFRIDYLNNQGKHGHARVGKVTSEYHTWASIKKRCLNPNNKQFKDYGGRGITMDESWINSFENFINYILNSIGLKPSPAHSIDRIDNNGNYEPGNIKWATQKEQQRNKRTSTYILFKGKYLTIAEVSELTGIDPRKLQYRLKAKWPLKRLLTP